ncbi:MAG TPA: hypothetical protein PKW49_03430 [Paludibacteraceae bacterium]|jgi:hypothetical protein|nr:hypothetical protein [Paludibacteraceae bacterium]
MNKRATITRNILGGGWRIEVHSRIMAVTIAEKVQDSDTPLFVDNVVLKYGCAAPSVVTVKGDRCYEQDLKEIVNDLYN